MPQVSGIAYWASVHQPNTKFEPTWTIEVLLSGDEAKKLKELSEELRQSPKDNPLKIVKDEDRGGYAVKIEQRVERASGEKNQAPRVVGEDGEPFTALIGNGSKVSVLFNLYRSEYKGKAWIKAGLRAVKVHELVKYAQQEEEDEFFKGSKKKTTDSSDDFDDDLPDFN